jgi:hypothetical protein
MNPTERTTDVHLRFNKLFDISDNTLNSKFQTRFLQPPCQACGSLEHPLLTLNTDITTSDNISYKYECPVVDESPLYDKDFEGTKIAYLLSSRTYAEYYKYDIEEATDKLILRANNTREIQPDYYNVFMNDVRRICIEYKRNNISHETQITQRNQSNGKRVSSKRKLEITKPNTTQDPNYLTPPAKNTRKHTNSNKTPEK